MVPSLDEANKAYLPVPRRWPVFSEPAATRPPSWGSGILDFDPRLGRASMVSIKPTVTCMGRLDQYSHLYKNGDRSWHRNDSFVDETGHATDLIAGEAVRFIATQRSKPFFLWVAFSVPHFPLQEEDKWVAPYSSSIKDPSRRLYAASVTHMDAGIGRITAALEKAGKLSETVDLLYERQRRSGGVPLRNGLWRQARTLSCPWQQSTTPRLEDGPLRGRSTGAGICLLAQPS